MARTNIPVVDGVLNGQSAISPVTLDPTNGHSVTSLGKARKVLFRVNNTTVSAKVVTFKAGAYPPAARSGIGDIALSVPASSATLIVVESSRVLQADGSVNIDVAASMTGTIEALRLPQGNA